MCVSSANSTIRNISRAVLAPVYAANAAGVEASQLLPGPKAPDPVAAVPPPDVSTINPTMTDSSPSETLASKRKRLAKLQYGLASTIATSPSGVGSLAPAVGPAVAGTATKDKLGQ